MAIKNKKEIQFEQPSELLLLANRYVMMIVALIVIIVLVGGYLFMLQPKIDSIRSVQVEDEETEERRQKNQELLDNIKLLEAAYLDIKENRADDLEFLRKMVPNDPQIAELFVTANYLAEQNNFELLELDISESVDDAQEPVRAVVEDINPEAQDPNSPLITSFNKKVDPADSLRSLVLHMAVRFEEPDEEDANPYEFFKNYLTDLESHLRLIDIQTVSFNEFVTPEVLEQAEGEEAIVMFNFDIITYFR